MPIPTLSTPERLAEVRYEIRGELARRAREREAQGHALIKLNIGNPGAFGFRAPDHMQRAIADHIVTLLPEPERLREVFRRLDRVLARRAARAPHSAAAV